jgi:NADH dehydrogenase FAD-containing subunit
MDVVVAGGGPAAAETALALHEPAGGQIRMTLVAPRPQEAIATRSVGPQPFRARQDHDRSTIRQTAARTGAPVRSGRVAAVDRDRRCVGLADGRRLAYDALVVATGARPRPVYERALVLRAGA